MSTKKLGINLTICYGLPNVYYEGKLENAKSNTKNTWKILNEVLNKKRRPRKLPSNFAVDNQNISDPLEIANCFCDYFTIGPNLAKTFPITSNSYKSFLTGNFVDSIFLDLTTEPEIINIVKSLRSGIAAGYDKISIWSVKDSSTLISSPLAHILNLSLKSGIVPDQLKIACVLPLFKSGDNNMLSNYRPIFGSAHLFQNI
jgi:hypothetical protein